MFLDSFDGAFGSVKALTKRKDDDWADKINHQYTVIMLVACAIVVSMGTYVGGRRIDCWTPAHFSGTWDSYTDDFCWVSNTYRIPWEDELPRPIKDREYVAFYQWVPFYLVGMALLFFIPYMAWRSCNYRSGLELHDIVMKACVYQKSDSVDHKARDDFLDDAVIDRILRFLKYGEMRATQRATGACAKSCGMCSSESQKMAHYLVKLYLIVKVIALVNTIAQLFLLSAFLGQGYLYGFNAVSEFIQGTVGESARFPRTTYCDVPVRRLGALHTYTVQCALPINLFHEMIFLLIWFWIFLVACLTALNVFTWIIKLSQGDRCKFIARQLQYKQRSADEDFSEDGRLKDFVTHYLQHDGVFIIRLIYENTDILTSSEVVMALWEYYTRERTKRKDERKRLLEEKSREREKLRNLPKAYKDKETV